MDSGRAPQGIGCGHSGHNSADGSGDRGAAPGGAAGEPGPVVAETSPLPAQDGVRGDDYQSLPPASPQPGQRDPKEPVAPAQPRPVRRSLVDGQLLPQGEVLEGELAVPAIEEGERRSSWSRVVIMGRRLSPDPTDQPLVRRTRFWRRTASRGSGNPRSRTGNAS